VEDVHIPLSIWKELMPHQIHGIKFMFNCLFGRTHKDYQNMSGCILADTMGLGKTLQAIALISILSKKSPY
jgi:DNA repair and recombination protein RAD54B